MVDTVIDPVRIPTINLSQAEIEEIEARIEIGELPRDYLDKHYKAVEDNVFGHDHRKDRKGEPIEQGLGSEGNMTRNAIEAYIKNQTERRQVPEAGYEENLKRMEATLAKCNEQRKARAPARRKGAR